MTMILGLSKHDFITLISPIIGGCILWYLHIPCISEEITLFILISLDILFIGMDFKTGLKYRSIGQPATISLIATLFEISSFSVKGNLFHYISFVYLIELLVYLLLFSVTRKY